MSTLGLVILVVIAVGGVAWVFLYPILSGENHTARRMASVARPEPSARPQRSTGPNKSRREQVEGTLKQIEERSKRAKRPPLAVRLKQAGLKWTKRRFMVTFAVVGVGAFFIMMMLGIGLVVAILLARAARGLRAPPGSGYS